MRVREAKDFLVQQTTEQAAREGITLSELEKRMMYFTEGSGAEEDPSALNDEFEAQYDTKKYQKKISALMRHAYKRTKKEAPEQARIWDNAIRRLRKGDHYILVLWGHPLSHGPSRDLFAFLLVLSPVLLLLVFAFFVMPGRNGQWPFSSLIPLPNPLVLQVLFIALLVGTVFFPHIVLRPVDRLFEKIDKYCFPEEHKQKEG